MPGSGMVPDHRRAFGARIAFSSEQGSWTVLNGNYSINCSVNTEDEGQD